MLAHGRELGLGQLGGRSTPSRRRLSRLEMTAEQRPRPAS